MATGKLLKAIFAEGELVADSVVNHCLTTAAGSNNYWVSEAIDKHVEVNDGCS
jgi:hypothetical protein